MEKKIYITALHLQHGGVEMAISLLSNAFVKKGYKVEILCIYNLGKPAYYLDSEVNIKYLTNVRPNREQFHEAVMQHNLWKIIREGLYAIKVLLLKDRVMKRAFQDIDDGIVISTRNEHSVLLSRYGKRKVKKIAQLHHDHNFEKKYVNSFKYDYKNIDAFVLLTDELKAEVEDIMKGYNTKTRCVTIPNFLRSGEEAANLNKKEKMVIAVGRLHSVKGFDRMLDIWKEVVRDNDSWKLKIIGNGEERDALQNKININDLEKSVELAGEKTHEDVMKELEKSALYLMTSYSEGFPFVLIEAMSKGNPVIAYDVRVGPRAIIEDGKNGFLIKDGGLDEFKDRVIELMRNREKRNEMAAEAIRRSNDFTEERVMELWELLIDEDKKTC